MIRGARASRVFFFTFALAFCAILASVASCARPVRSCDPVTGRLRGLGLGVRAPRAHDSLSADETAALRPGDIVLRRGSGIASEVIAGFFGEDWRVSHCALVVVPGAGEIASIPAGRVSYSLGASLAAASIRAGRPAVIHSVNERLSGVDGIQIEDLEHFYLTSEPESIVVVRPLMSAVESSAALAESTALLARGLPFDNGYSLESTDDAYCAELLYRLFAAANWEGQSAWLWKKEILSFGGFLDPRYFRVIVSHNPAVKPSVGAMRPN